jgi:hypothetical protein
MVGGQESLLTNERGNTQYIICFVLSNFQVFAFSRFRVFEFSSFRVFEFSSFRVLECSSVRVLEFSSVRVFAFREFNIQERYLISDLMFRFRNYYFIHFSLVY